MRSFVALKHQLHLLAVAYIGASGVHDNPGIYATKMRKKSGVSHGLLHAKRHGLVVHQFDMFTCAIKVGGIGVSGDSIIGPEEWLI